MHFRIGRTQIGHAAAFHEDVLVRKRHRLKSPMPLEMVRSGTLAAPTKVKRSETSSGRPAEQLPVHEVIHRVSQRIPERTAVVGECLVFEEEREYPGHRGSVLPDSQELAILAELLRESREETTRVHRRTQSVDAVGVDVPEGVKMTQAELGAQAVLETLARHPTLLARNRLQVLLIAGGHRSGERHVERLGGQVLQLLTGSVPELNVVSLDPMSQIGGGLHQGRT